MPVYKSGQVSEVLPEGEYRFRIEQARNRTSSNGNEMIELWLRLPKGGLAIDNLVFTSSAYWKIDQFRVSIGELVLPDEDVEVRPSELIDRTGWAHITVEIYEGKSKNRVGAYLEPRAGDDDQLIGLE